MCVCDRDREDYVQVTKADVCVSPVVGQWFLFFSFVVSRNQSKNLSTPTSNTFINKSTVNIRD